MDANEDGSQDLQDAHDASRDDRLGATIARTVTGFARTQVAAERLEQATQRDQDAHIRDITAKARDLAAEALDRTAAEAARRAGASVAPRDRRLHHEALKYAGVVAETANAARARAAADRAQAAKDRERAAMDREQAAADREQARVALNWAHLDDLTGAYQRGIGLDAIQNEIDRVRRGDGRLVLGFVDVDGLKLINDRGGHAAGDELPRAVAEAMRSKMRSYEPIVRFGGDEFVCALANMDVGAASDRFDEIRAVLNGGEPRATISVGLASLEPDDDLDQLIERADRALTKARRG